jgi:hypothetical protein
MADAEKSTPTTSAAPQLQAVRPEMALQVQNPFPGKRRQFFGFDDVEPILSRPQPLQVVAARSEMDRDPVLPMQTIETTPFGFRHV